MGEAMTTETQDTSRQEAREEATPVSRLMDMLVGWSAYADESEGADSQVTSDDISALYQEAGGEWLKVDESDAYGEDAMVRRFVEERVVPLLVRRKSA